MNIAIVALMCVAAVVVLLGFVLMVKGGKLNQKYGNKLMVLRVIVQALALLLVFIVAMMAGKG